MWRKAEVSNRHQSPWAIPARAPLSYWARATSAPCSKIQPEFDSTPAPAPSWTR